MKTAISIPDPLFHAAQRVARSLHISRSKLVSDALSQHLKTIQERDITTRLNKVYTDLASPSAIPEALQTMQALSIEREEW